MAPARTMVQVHSPLKLSLSTRHQPRTCIFTLPDDILLLIIGFVGVKEILTLRKTSKRLCSMTKLRWVWSNAMKKHVIDKGLPVPAAAGIEAVSASALDLESRTVHAAKFHENWYSDRPTARRSIVFHDEFHESASERPPVRQVLFLPGRDGQYLATVTRRSIICWEVPLQGGQAYRVAEWRCEPLHHIEKVVVNEDPESKATLACICGQQLDATTAELNVLTLDAFHGRLIPRSVLRSSRSMVFPLHTMRGDWIAFGDPLLIWNMSSVSPRELTKPIRTRNLNDHTRVLTAKFIGEYLLVVRQSSVQLLGYNQRDSRGNPFIPGHSAGLAYPACEAVIVCRSAKEDSWPSEPISVIMRCIDDGFDTIRQYDLPPNPKAKVRPANDSSPDQYSYPCLFPLHYTRAQGVAPSAMNMIVGQNGKGMWMETRNVTSRQSVFTARCLVGFDVSKAAPSGTWTCACSCTGNGGTGLKRLACGTVEGESNDLHVSKNELFARRCSMSEVNNKLYALRCADLEDSVGRVALGFWNGTVEVLDYV